MNIWKTCPASVETIILLKFSSSVVWRRQGKLLLSTLSTGDFEALLTLTISTIKLQTLFFDGVKSVVKDYKVPARRLLVTREVGEVSETWQKFCDKIDNWAKEWGTPMAISGVQN